MNLASVIIIHYKQDLLTHHVLQCLDRHQKTTPVEVIVVDNASPSVYIAPKLNALRRVKVVRLKSGLGFGGACETGIQASSPKLHNLPFIVLNNDLSFQDDLVAGLLASQKDHPSSGIIGPRILFPDGRFQLSWGDDLSIQSEREERERQKEMLQGDGALYKAREQESKKARHVDWVSGASFLITRKALDAVDSLERGYFFYFEDCDWCRRVRQAGLQIWYDPRVSIRHALGASRPKQDQSPHALRFYRSRELGHLRYYAHFNSWFQFQFLKLILAFKALKNKDWFLLKEICICTRSCAKTRPMSSDRN